MPTHPSLGGRANDLADALDYITEAARNGSIDAIRERVRGLAKAARLLAKDLGGECEHANTRNLYDQRPPSEGRKLVPAARLCEDCGTPVRLDR